MDTRLSSLSLIYTYNVYTAYICACDCVYICMNVCMFVYACVCKCWSIYTCVVCMYILGHLFPRWHQNLKKYVKNPFANFINTDKAMQCSTQTSVYHYYTNHNYRRPEWDWGLTWGWWDRRWTWGQSQPGLGGRRESWFPAGSGHPTLLVPSGGSTRPLALSDLWVLARITVV